jgi:hypothetical protein
MEPDLFGFVASRPESEQDRQIKRVAGKIAPAILSFIRTLGVGSEFRASELHSYVGEQFGTAPASADRILRLLRAEGKLDYRVVDRRASLYRIEDVS